MPAVPPELAARRHRVYTEDDQAEALVVLEANGGHVARTARELGISHETLRCWARGKRRPINPEVLETVKAEMSDGFARLARLSLKQASEKVETMSGSAATIAAAVATDKFLLLNGEGPRGSGTVNVTVNTVNVSAAVLSPQDVHQARSLLSSVLALPSSSESLGGPSCDERDAVSLPERSETAQKALPVPESFPDPPG